jgi:hypothetical protein
MGVPRVDASVSPDLFTPIFQQGAILNLYVRRIGAKARSSNGVIPTAEAPQDEIPRDSGARNEFGPRWGAPKLPVNAGDGIGDVLLV